MFFSKRIVLFVLLLLVVVTSVSQNSIATQMPEPPLIVPPDVKTVVWDVGISHPFVEKGTATEQLVNIKLTGRKDIPMLARAPVNLAIVIDRSGSMSDKGKISYAKKAAKEIINRLQASDRLSIIAYSTEVQVLFPIQPLSNKDAAISAVDSLYPTNSTNLSGGLIYGISQLESVSRAGYINRVILLSDGLANEGITDIGELSRISSIASEKNIQITTMGLGLDYDENLLLCIAQYGAGNYYFIESPNQLAAIFQKEFGQLSTTIAKSPTITITLEPGVSIEQIYGYSYSSSSDEKIKIKLGDMFAGQQRDILIKVNVPTDKIGEKGLLKADLSYEDLLDNNQKSNISKALSYLVTKDKSIVDQNLNEAVLARGVSVDAAFGLDQAILDYEEGRPGEALLELNDSYKRIQVVNKSRYKNEQTVKQEEELKAMIQDLRAAPPEPESDQGKKMIKKQKANAYNYQQ
ncbi:MAG: VWA domain-containing protein [Thermodesulfobacteriota bacterium]